MGVKAADNYKEAKNFIGGKFVPHQGNFLSVYSPIDGSEISKVPLSTAEELDTAVKSAKAAFPEWSKKTLRERVAVLYRYRSLMEKHANEIAQLLHEENGKTIPESLAEVAKGIEVTEFACALPQMGTSEVLEVSQGIECRIERRPVGIVASITPFNFPFMVPNWTIPNTLALGNCMIIKPSETVPLCSLKIAELLKEAGLPDGVFNIVHGDRVIVEAICDHPGINAVTFVGSTKVAKLVYARATSTFKRALCLGGAKNHLIVLPDANVQMTASDVVASMSGCAGQRCMAASAMVGVGDVESIIGKIVEEAKKIIPGENLGSVISKEAKERIENYIAEAEKAGAKILVDGRSSVVKGKEKGYYVGPTVIDYVKPDMRIAKEEVFGPVLAIMRTKDINEAIEIENSSKYGNAASVYTSNIDLARQVMARVSAGMTGINIGVPVPREPFSFGGWNESKFGAGDITGKSSIEFLTIPRKMTSKWNPRDKKDWMS